MTKILVTGATGFLGQHVMEKIPSAVGIGSKRTDLRNYAQTEYLFDQERPEVVVHLAAVVGGIGANMASPADFWRDNLLMGINVLEACRVRKVRKLVLIGTTCSYPHTPPNIPFIEEDLFDGYPEPTNAPYGIAKRALFVGAEAYMRQYGLEIVLLIPTNLYGPGDHYDREKSHVIPAMIRKFHEAKLAGIKSVTLWGTGAPTRDFVYVADVASAIAGAVQPCEIPGPINLGSGKEVSMKELASTISNVVGFQGSVIWNITKPDGQPRRCLDTTLAQAYLGWRASKKLPDGLALTYEDFLDSNK